MHMAIKSDFERSEIEEIMAKRVNFTCPALQPNLLSWMGLQHTKGRLIAEVLNVVYLGRDELSPDKQLGTIILATDLEKDRHYIYNVDSVDMNKPIIKPGDELTLTGPSSIPYHSGYVSVEIDLFSGAYKGFLTVEVPPYCGLAFRTIERRMLSKDGTGQVCVLFGLSYNARAAFLDLQLFPQPQVSPDAKVHGVVSARAWLVWGPKNSRLLFSKEPEYKIRLKSSDFIPLSRNMVAVPLGYELLVDIAISNEHDHGTDTIRGNLVFLHDTHQTILLGENSGVKGTVHWKVTSAMEPDNDDVWLADGEFRYDFKPWHASPDALLIKDMFGDW